MSTETRRPVDEGVALYVQRLDWKCAGLRVLNCQVIRAGEPAAGAACLLEQYQTAYAAHRAAMDELICQVMPQFVDGKTQFHLDYTTFELVASREDA